MITILCSGSRGDFQPYIALAQRLKQKGQAVRIAGGKSFEDFVRGYGVDFYPFAADIDTVGVDPKLLEVAGASDNPLKMLLAFNKMKDYGIYMIEDSVRACEGNELIVYHPGCTAGYFAARQMGIPAVLAAPFPLHRTKEHLSVILYGKANANALNITLSYTMLQSMLWMVAAGSIKPFWKQKYGRLPEGFGKPFENTSAMYPAIVSCSNHVFSRPKDWGPHIHQEGYWFTQEPENYTPPPALASFLQAGKKPVYIGFGSMTMTQATEDLHRIAVSALQKTGQRGVLSGLGDSTGLPEGMLAIDSIPHTWLFANMAAVCHHGGAGTSAAGFRAGVPSAIVPFSNDQFAWAHRAYDLGVGAKPVYRKHLNADNLARAIEAALQKEVAERAAALGEEIRAEKGAESCAEVILGCLKG